MLVLSVGISNIEMLSIMVMISGLVIIDSMMVFVEIMESFVIVRILVLMCGMSRGVIMVFVSIMVLIDVFRVLIRSFECLFCWRVYMMVVIVVLKLRLMIVVMSSILLRLGWESSYLNFLCSFFYVLGFIVGGVVEVLKFRLFVVFVVCLGLMCCVVCRWFGFLFVLIILV